MAIYPSNADLLGREFRRDRMQEAEHWRLFKTTDAWSPSLPVKLGIILRSRWQILWSGKRNRRRYISITEAPKGTTIS